MFYLFWFCLCSSFDFIYSRILFHYKVRDVMNSESDILLETGCVEICPSVTFAVVWALTTKKHVLQQPVTRLTFRNCELDTRPATEQAQNPTFLQRVLQD